MPPLRLRSHFSPHRSWSNGPGFLSAYDINRTFNAIVGGSANYLFRLLPGSEKLIADQLERSYHTTYEWVTSIYRKFGVKNRASLMSLWLGQVS